MLEEKPKVRLNCRQRLDLIGAGRATLKSIGFIQDALRRFKTRLHNPIYIMRVTLVTQYRIKESKEEVGRTIRRLSLPSRW